MWNVGEWIFFTKHWNFYQTKKLQHVPWNTKNDQLPVQSYIHLKNTSIIHLIPKKSCGFCVNQCELVLTYFSPSRFIVVCWSRSSHCALGITLHLLLSLLNSLWLVLHPDVHTWSSCHLCLISQTDSEWNHSSAC